MSIEYEQNLQFQERIREIMDHALYCTFLHNMQSVTGVEDVCITALSTCKLDKQTHSRKA